ncbi:MAG: ABC transporter ATP-binding protein [Candidatus Marinimicrobia bacterium]|jgi:lipoprotein-releasing system ATP-binding protein|nr:ABC transporter ATP-binding protein [Candidatus Neomarinimicrobiota bacterium]MBT3630347.1 ABC transporter ATP-binding protein [Candidatus Neomarinimicrobiota bacterium]MBT3823667.1 ABC transporter ATP-binding protein [Candidatus Neomarinimicrobiota bacterium]MBT4131985.1 ABC transporter ATP-binding protein [Candidatus Neomarinimicrobiota bacterium]MBT4421052.1 ABC transporter ATP-binding protein [Candidatus Neomarinimicrobiota bacterium]
MNTILQVIDINKSYSAVGENLDVLKNVNLSMEKGEIVAINGPSGIGKTTLLNIIGTLDTADSGELIISGKSPTNMNDQALSTFRAENLGYIFQFHYLLPEFTALENVLIPAKIVDLDKVVANERAKSLLEAVGVYERRHHKPSQLSGGERQRVAVARALMNRPELVLADEPTGNLDPDNGKRLIDLIHSVRKEYDQSFLIATHSRSLSAACDRVISLT